MRYTNEKTEAVSQINDPSLQYIVQTIYQFYRTTGSLGAAISQAAEHLNMSSADVSAVAEEYELTDEMEDNPGSIDPADAVTLGEDFQIPGTDVILEAGDSIVVHERSSTKNACK